jgi:SWI/SNF-related matrix-associated actin-dependent regulator of chromatin subfamily A3
MIQLTSMQIYRTSVKLCGNMAELDKKLSIGGASPIQGHLQMNLVKPESHFQVTFSDGMVLGELNMQLETALARISEQRFQIQYEVFANIRAVRETISKVTKEKEAIVRVQINMYGNPSVAGKIGRELSKAKIYLQCPDYIQAGVSYDNPHILKLQSFQATEPTPEQQTNQQSTETESAKDLEQVISDVYSSLTRNNNLEGLEGDERLETQLLPYVIHQECTHDHVFNNPQSSGKSSGFHDTA